jgi:hypothetical protein
VHGCPYFSMQNVFWVVIRYWGKTSRTAVIDEHYSLSLG